jgi:formylglycine-generating enzyme required for sulfatase activity
MIPVSEPSAVRPRATSSNPWCPAAYASRLTGLKASTIYLTSEITFIKKTDSKTKPWVEHGNTDLYRAGASYPAVYINHTDAMAFCEKLTELERAAGRLPVGWSYTLPTEAQWEYAGRAGTKTKYSLGDDDATLGDYAWFDKNAYDIDEAYAHLVGKKKPNPWKLRDMHGNVWEWCSDWKDKDYKTSPGRDPRGPVEGSHRVFRGGSWLTSARSAWLSARNLPPMFHHVFGD